MKQNKFFPEIRGNFGFGCMRLPMNGEEVDHAEFCRMADAFIAAGFNISTRHTAISKANRRRQSQRACHPVIRASAFS